MSNGMRYQIQKFRKLAYYVTSPFLSHYFAVRFSVIYLTAESEKVLSVNVDALEIILPCS